MRFSKQIKATSALTITASKLLAARSTQRVAGLVVDGIRESLQGVRVSFTKKEREEASRLASLAFESSDVIAGTTARERRRAARAAARAAAAAAVPATTEVTKVTEVTEVTN